jgi:hypothetical protein
LIVGSLGLGCGIAAVLVLAAQLFVAVRDNRWITLGPRALIEDTVLRAAVPAAVRSWIERPASLTWLHPIVVWVLDELPLTVFLGGIGLLLMWIALRSERSGSW